MRYLKISTMFTAYCLLLTVLVGCQGGSVSPPPARKVLARVDGMEITLERFQDSWKRFISESEPALDIKGEEMKELKRGLLNQLIEEELILQEGRSMGLEVKDEEVSREIEGIKKEYKEEGLQAVILQRYRGMEGWEEELKRKLLIRKVIDEVIAPGVEVREEEAFNYYKDHPGEYNVREQVRARMIVVGTEEEANRIRARLKKGEEFAMVAEEVSLGPEGKRGGDLGFFGRGEMLKEFEDVVFTLPVGKLSPVVKTPYGYHIFLVEERRKARVLRYPEVREKIMAWLKMEKVDKEFQDWVKRLKERARIEVREELL